jgi:hypothetical protein
MNVSDLFPRSPPTGLFTGIHCTNFSLPRVTRTIQEGREFPCCAPLFLDGRGWRSRAGFLARVSSCNLFFNLARKNSGKENKTPRELVLAKRPTAGPLLPLLEPVFLDELLFNQLHNSSQRGYNAWAQQRVKILEERIDPPKKKQ